MKALLLTLSLASPLFGQAITATAVLNQPATATVVDPAGTPTTLTVPGGTPLLGAVLDLRTPTGFAIVSGSTASTPTAVSLTVNEIHILSGARSTCIGPTDALCSFAASAPTPVRLVLLWTAVGVLTSAQASVQVDVGNDGTMEFGSNAPNTTVSLGRFTLGPTPLLVRLTMQSAATVNILNHRAILQVVPDFGETIQAFSAPCTTATMMAQPTFLGTLQLSALSAIGPQFLVIGLRATPTPLPFASPQPCLLIPSTDVVVGLPPSGLIAFPISLLRGTPLWLQSVAFVSAGPVTTLVPSVTIFAFFP